MKHLSTFKNALLIFVLVIMANAAQCQLPATPPIAWWSMAPSPSVDTILPENTLGYHGVLNNWAAGKPKFVDGKVGNALQFTKTDTNYVFVPDTVNYISDGTFTICFWVEIDTATEKTWSVPFCTGTWGMNAVGFNFVNDKVTPTNGYVRARIWDNVGAYRMTHRAARAAFVNLFEKKWMHLALICWNDSAKLYVDGVQGAKSTAILSGFDEKNGPTYIGVSNYAEGMGDYFNGKIDEIRIYDYSLTPEEVVSLMGITSQVQLQTKEFKLVHYPNPFKDATTISYTLQRAGNVTLDILNINGQHVKTLVNNRSQQVNNYKEMWDCRSDNGQIQPAGIYFYRLKLDNETVGIGKMMLAK